MGKHTQFAGALLASLKDQSEFTETIFGRRIDIDFVHGVLVVKDWAGNLHDVQAIESVDYFTHAENVMLRWLQEKYGRTGIPFPAKVIFYLSASPCRRCTTQLPDWILGAYQVLAQQYPLYFSLVFSRYYLDSSQSDTSNRARQNIWETPEEADAAYRAAEGEADRVSGEAFGVVGILNIRHVAQTKSGPENAQWRRKAPFRYDINRVAWGGKQ